jgi:AcrR family transcriptional regulator
VDAGINKLRNRRRQQTRSEIVRAAFELFGRLGYERVSMDSVASAAGVARATLFNYFPKKELILHEIAAARAQKLSIMLSEFAQSGETASFDSILELILDIAAENAKITAGAKKLFLETFFRQVTQGSLLAARTNAIDALAKSIARIPGHRKKARLVAETLFAVFLATMMEWLMREEVPQKWLVNTMRQRLQLLHKGVE